MNNMNYDLVPDCSSVSQLETITRHDAAEQLSNTLFLVSQPYEGTHTGYISKNVSFDVILSTLNDRFGVDATVQSIKELSADLYAYLDFVRRQNRTLCADVERPYILSNLTQLSGVIISADGYRLGDGMANVFETTQFDEISVNNVDVNFINGTSVSEFGGKVTLVDWTEEA